MVCAVAVVDGVESTVPADDDEQDAIRLRLSPYLRRPNSRLACRLEFTGDGAVIEKKGVRPPPDAQN
jgi:ferredoxin